jgi:periplasmic protein TonB
MFDRLRDVLDFDDLLFETRNRDYGAYQLRKRYNSVVVTGIIIGTLMVSTAVVLPFVLTPHSDHIITGRIISFQVQMEKLEPPIDKIIVPSAPPPPDAVRLQEIVKYVPPVVVDTVIPLEETQTTTDQFLSQPADLAAVNSIGAGDDLFSGEEGTGSDEPFFWVEQMPSFKGGDINKFRDWVQRRTNYPQIAIDKKIQGKVLLTFIVESDGSVSHVTVVKGVDKIIDDEAVKAIQASPKWSPGLQRGQPVRVRYSMSLSFVY